MRIITIVWIILFGILGLTTTLVPAEKSAEVSHTEQSASSGIQKKVISMPGAANNTAPYNPAIQFGNLLYLSGQLGIDPRTRRLVSDDVGNQTQQALHNIRVLLNAAGSDITKLLQCRIFLTDINDFQLMNQIYASFFPSSGDYPTRTAIAVKSLPANGKVEIECTAYTEGTYRNEALMNGYGPLIIPVNCVVLSLSFHLATLLFTFQF